MLQIVIPETELFNSKDNTFVSVKETHLSLEHSLVSISKWESTWNKPFLNDSKKTNEEVIDYIKCMTITQNVDPLVYSCIPSSEFEKINNYISAPMTATTFSSHPNNGKKQVITSELIYYWMVAFQIPFECQKWHLNRLLTLVKICDIKNNPGKKMGRNEIINQNKSLNAARRAAMNSRG